VSTPAVREQAAVLALTRASPAEWYRTATVIYEAGSALAIVEGRGDALMTDIHREYAEQLKLKVEPSDLDAAEQLIQRTADHGVQLLTVLDEGYPDNLHLVYNRPPFIWVRGELHSEDFRATRASSPE
jgi:DNA processing protein